MGSVPDPEYVLGIDLDGVVADFYGRARELVAEWRGVPVETLEPEVSFGLREWGLDEHEDYCRFHRHAVRERRIFRDLPVIPGAPQAIRRLAKAGVRIRVITHRLYVDYLHRAAAEQTAQWLDAQGIPYRDLCFVEDKTAVRADLYVDDSPANIEALQAAGCRVIAFTNSTNAELRDVRLRAFTWDDVEQIVMDDHRAWSNRHRSWPATA